MIGTRDKRSLKGIGMIYSKPCSDLGTVRRPKPIPKPEKPDFIKEGEFKV